MILVSVCDRSQDEVSRSKAEVCAMPSVENVLLEYPTKLLHHWCVWVAFEGRDAWKVWPAMSLAVGVYAFVFFFVGNETDFCQSDTISFFSNRKMCFPRQHIAIFVFHTQFYNLGCFVSGFR